MKNEPTYEELSTRVKQLEHEVDKYKRSGPTIKEALQTASDIVDAIPSGLFIYQFEPPNTFTLVSSNPEADRLSGMMLSKWLGKEFSDIWPMKSTGDLKKSFISVMETGKTYETEDFRYKDDRMEAYFRFRAFRMPQNMLGIAFEDISQRKQAEKEKNRLETQLVQSQKMEAIGTLAGGVAHDFNNLMMGMLGNISLILYDMDESHPYYEKLKTIEKQIQSGSQLTSRLLHYARRGRYEVKPLNINEIVEAGLETFGRTRKEITIRKDLSDNLYAIEADQGQIEQALLNLYVNASDAMPDGGDLHINTSTVTDKDMANKPYQPKPGNYVLIEISDNGIGMDDNTVRRVFEPFFTTKEMGRGTGLGLASVYGITKGHGGYIDVDSVKGRGTTFTIYLPATDIIVQKQSNDLEENNAAQETILLVDDEGVIIKTGRQMLERLGFTIMAADTGSEAIQIYEKHMNEIGMVILDMVMPEVSGSETYDRLKRLNPEVKVLLYSGYSINGKAEELLDRGCNDFIQKPFTMDQLNKKVRKLLAS